MWKTNCELPFKSAILNREKKEMSARRLPGGRFPFWLRPEDGNHMPNPDSNGAEGAITRTAGAPGPKTKQWMGATTQALCLLKN